jgi:hypothetical protein
METLRTPEKIGTVGTKSIFERLEPSAAIETFECLERLQRKEAMELLEPLF